jgi:ribosomal protein S27AE
VRQDRDALRDAAAAMTARIEDEFVSRLEVRCAMCGWEWIAAYLPMPIRDACKIMKRGRCPKCAVGAKHILMFWDSKNPPAPKRSVP